MAAPALVALAHGSRDPRSAATINALVDEVRAMRPDLRDRAGVPRAVQAVVRRRSSTGWSSAGYDEIVVVPLLLTEAYHAKVDVPERRRRGARPGTPGCRSGPPRSSASRRASSRCSTCGCARRSRRPGSASSTRWCWPPPAPATRSPTRPSPGWPGSGAPATSCRSPRRSPRPRPPATGEAVRAFRAEGRRHIAVASLFLAPGLPARPGRRAGPRGRRRRGLRAARRPPRAGPHRPGALRRRRGRARPRLTRPRSRLASADEVRQQVARAGGPGRSVTPPCTGPGWSTVLRGP